MSRVSKIAKEIGKNIETLRKEKGETQADVQHAIGVSKAAMIAMMEDGRRPPKAEYLFKLAQHFGVSIDYLFDSSRPRTTNPDLQTAIATTGLTEHSIKKLQYMKVQSILDCCNALLSSEYSLRFIAAMDSLKTVCKAIKETEQIDTETAETLLYSARWKLNAVFDEILKTVCDYQSTAGFIENLKEQTLLTDLANAYQEAIKKGETNGNDKAD